MNDTAGFFGHFSTITAKFIAACNNAGIALKSDLNTPDGTLGVAKVGRSPRPQAQVIDGLPTA
jgi:hypothetical protein